MSARSVSTTARAAVLALVVAVLPVAPSVAQDGAEFDVVLRNGTVFDGTGREGYIADTAIVDGYIAEVGDLSEATAEIDIDVTGQYVAPGFIDLHSHSAASALPTAANVLTQGVTTELLNPDGGSPLNLDAQLAELEASGLAVNVGPYIGFNSVWRSVVGSEDVPATSEQIRQMRNLIVDGLRDGAWGVSAGLDYVPAYYASTDQVAEVVKAAADWRTNFPNHERLTPEDNYSSRVGIAETIEIGERSDVAPVITHMKVQGHEQGSADEVLGMMSAATARGNFTAADVYPYLAGQTGLANLIIPSWAQAGGRQAMLARFADPELREQIIAEAEEAMLLRFNGPEGVYVLGVGELVDIMDELDVGAGEAVIRVLEVQNRSAILTFGSEDDLVKIMQYEDTAIASDGGATFSPSHPRRFGTFPRVLGRYVREQDVLSWEEAIRKMTGLPATIVGMTDRGFLVPGMAADVTVFDPGTVIDNATFEDPGAFSDGIEHVFVNGVHAVRDGDVTGAQGGQALRRSQHEPTRPMHVDADRRVAAEGMVLSPAPPKGQAAAVKVSFDVSQAGGGVEVNGQFRLADPESGVTIESTRLGLLQVSEEWASFTGRAIVLPSGEERSVTVTVEQSDPFVPGRRATVIVDVEDVYHVIGQLVPNRVTLERQ